MSDAGARFPTQPGHGGDKCGTPTDHRKRKRSDALYLVVKTQPPSYVFPGEEFELGFELEGSNSPNNSPPSNVEVRASLILMTTHSTGMLDVLHMPRVSVGRREAKAKCRVNTNGPISPHTGCIVQIKLQPKEEQLNIIPCQTSDIHLVNAKINFTPGENWTGQFFKDEGGRDNCMEGTVGLLGGENRHPTSQRFSLDTTLYYKDPLEPVREQGILKQLGSMDALQVTERSRANKLRYRIEHVSRKHRDQQFLVRIAAPDNVRDVAPGFTPPVTVLSKRVKPPPSRPPKEVAPPSTVPPNIDVTATATALQVITQWAKDVEASLRYMQWQPLGFEVPNAGNYGDFHHPLWQMQNPNQIISRLLSLYNSRVQTELGVLQSTINSLMESQVPGTGQHQQPVYPPRDVPQRYAPSVPDFSQNIPQNIPQHHHQPSAPPGFGETYFHHGNYGHAYSSGISLTEEDRRAAMPRESLVEFVLACEYTSSRNGELLGYPAYSENREILGFYRMRHGGGDYQFHPIDPREFGEPERTKAKEILQQEMSQHPRAVVRLSEAGSISTLMHLVMVYIFEKEAQRRQDTNR